MVMAEEMGITAEALSCWLRRRETKRLPVSPGRPEAISADARWKLRSCYLSHYKQWGPRVLRDWAP